MYNNKERNHTYIKFKEHTGEHIEIINKEENFLLWIKEDNCNCHVNFTETALPPNTLLYLNKGEVFACNKNSYHTVSTISFLNTHFGSSTNLINIFFNSLLYEDTKNTSKVQFYDLMSSKKIDECFEKVANNGNSQDLVELKGILDNILIESLNVRMKKNYTFITQFKELLDSQYKINHIVSNYANQLDSPPKELLRKLQEQGFHKPSHIIKRKILLEIKKLLVYTDLSAKDICLEVGFDDPAYFARFFKKNTGITSQEFRRLYRKK